MSIHDSHQETAPPRAVSIPGKTRHIAPDFLQPCVRPNYDSRAWIEVDLSALQSNARALRSHFEPGVTVMAILKADAYGHGLVPIANAAVENRMSWLGVATAAEGVALREAGITASIAVLCTPAPQEAPAIVEYGLTPMVGDEGFCAALSHAKGDANLAVHLDIDTGIGRSGVLAENAVELWRQCVRGGLTVTGICTHFADADGSDSDLTTLQWRRFDGARAALRNAGASVEWVHAGNTAAGLRCESNGCNLVRPGLLLYGILPNFARSGAAAAPLRGQNEAWPWDDRRAQALLDLLKPVLTLKARVAAVRDVPAGHTISYGATHRLKRRSHVATVLIGYGDGYPRRLSNKGYVLIHGMRAPILGRVCMDQIVVDVTDLPEAVAAGEICTCIGSDGGESITAESIAQTIQTTEHEITTCLTSRLPRHNTNPIPISS